ncbi:DUF2971 domain-containing protein [Microbulbifer sp. SAOS-129_SWC]|uniref:DUF2971 domain-containing protein n=1 Tax=Microbulbifer sp. SAOS-129_SWC TaxID=3145235 RepID=UPI003216DEA7
MYYRYRPFSELSIKELMYSELFLASTEECNDPYDSKGFYEFTGRQDYWENLVNLLVRKIGNNNVSGLQIKEVAGKISSLCPLTYDEALLLDISRLCFEVLKDFTLSQSLAACFNQLLKIYKPEPSYFACFSKADNDPLMWSHYASQHQGYSLIFKPIDGKLRQYPPLKKRSISRKTPNGLAQNSSYGLPESFSFQEVIYQEEVKSLCGFHRLPVAVIGGDLPEEERINLITLQSEQFLHKHISWDYEQEVRVSISPRMSWIFGKNIELSSLERLFYYEPTQLVGIIFGARMPKGNKDRLMEVLLYRQEQLYRSEDHERIMFEFAVFNARLSGSKREIQVEIDKMISSGQEIDKSHKNFEHAYDRWRNGWGIKFEGNKSNRIQVLG